MKNKATQTSDKGTMVTVELTQKQAQVKELKITLDELKYKVICEREKLKKVQKQKEIETSSKEKEFGKNYIVPKLNPKVWSEKKRYMNKLDPKKALELKRAKRQRQRNKKRAAASAAYESVREPHFVNNSRDLSTSSEEEPRANGGRGPAGRGRARV